MDRELLILLKKAKKLGIKKVTVGDKSFEFFDRPEWKPSQQDLTGEPNHRMPTDDEMLFYSTDEFDRMIEERKEASKHETN